jgi:hypothetical protein
MCVGHPDDRRLVFCDNTSLAHPMGPLHQLFIYMPPSKNDVVGNNIDQSEWPEAKNRSTPTRGPQLGALRVLQLGT